SGPDEPITQPTNRGNKLRVNAKYVHEGALGFAHLQELYKEKVEHAGYTRYILQRNPQRYDSEGDELDDDDADSDADAAAAEENPFSEIALERLLCPLKHPSELPTHPSMAHPYRSKALRTMTLAIEEKLRKERALLWRARNLHRQFLGDACWMPCGKVETPEDRYIFEPRRANDGSTSSMSRQGHNRVASTYSPSSPRTKDQIHELSSARTSQKSLTAHQDEDQAGQAADTDIEMTDVTHSKARPNEESTEDDAKKPKTEDIDAMVDDLPQHLEVYAARMVIFAGVKDCSNCIYYKEHNELQRIFFICDVGVAVALNVDSCIVSRQFLYGVPILIFDKRLLNLLGPS
ncbi:RXT2-like, N-terminal domain containing protein, partial [Elaphomyces granulatus]